MTSQQETSIISPSSLQAEEEIKLQCHAKISEAPTSATPVGLEGVIFFTNKRVVWVTETNEVDILYSSIKGHLVSKSGSILMKLCTVSSDPKVKGIIFFVCLLWWFSFSA